MSSTVKIKEENKNQKLVSNIKRYQNDYLKEERKVAPLRMQIHLKQS